MIRVRIVSLLAMALLAEGAAARPSSKPQPVRRADWVHMVAPTPDGGMRMGNPNAAIKVVEYGSRTCPHCARFNAEGLPALKAKYIASGNVSYEFRDFPVHGALDLGPILLGRCLRPAQFFPVLDDMFRNQDALLAKVDSVSASMRPGADPNEVAKTFATGLGYDKLVQRAGVPADKLAKCLADRAGIDRIVSETSTAEKVGKVDGTPAFFINGQLAAAVYDWAALEPMLVSAGKK
jgi:protein-disulfide isomerase